jgi:AraC-like DNA-binding protein
MVEASKFDTAARRSRPCRAPAGLGLVLAELGVSVSAGVLTEPRPWLTIDDYFGLWDAIAAGTGDPTLGARLGARYPDDLLEPAFLACLGSRDLGEALERLSRYKRTLCPETLTLVRRGDRIEVRYEWPTARRPPPPILVEAELSFLLHLARKATRQPLRDARVELTRPFADPAPWASILHAEVRLGVTTAALHLSASALTLPFATFNPSLLAALDPTLMAEQSLGSSARPDTVASVRHVLRSRLGDSETSLRHVTEELKTSARSLQRQLRDAGTSFAALLQETRRERATFYLRESELSLSEIAFLLGFDSPTSFFRAFARWTGQTPHAFRSGAIGEPRGAKSEGAAG